MGRYKFHTWLRPDGAREFLAISTYAGKKVKGKAVCSPDDECDYETGYKLAQLRCDIKIDKKRLKRASKQKSDLLDKEVWIQKKLLKNKSYLEDSIKQKEEDEKELKLLLSKLK